MTDADLQGYRLSPQQKRAWRISELGGAEGATWFVVQVAGCVSDEALRAALCQVTARHDALRTTFRRLPGMVLPVQSVRAALEPSWHAVDWSGYSPDMAGKQLECLLGEEAARLFDLETGPTVRATLVALPGDRRLVVSLSPLCADARSVDNLVRDLGLACMGAEAVDPAVSYLQVSEFQNALLEGDESADAREAWAREDLRSLPPLRLPFERASAGREAVQIERCIRPLPPELAAAVTATAQAASVSVPAVLLAAWQTLLWRLTGEVEVSVASLFDGRSFDVFQDAVGLFARWVPVTVRLETGLSFREVAARAAAAQSRAEGVADGFLWGETGEGPVVARELPALGFEALPWPTVNGSPLELCDRTVRGERCDLGLTCRIGDGSIVTELQFDASRFDREDMERTLGHLHRLLAAAVENPGRPVEELPLLDEDERRRLVVELNETGRGFDVSAPFHRLFERQAARVPEAPALVHGDRSLTYRELNERANRLARHLRGLGVGPEVPVALCLERSWGLVAALLAVWKAGGAFVPLEPQQPRKRLALMLEDVGTPVVVTQAEIGTGLPQTGAAVVRIDADWDVISCLSGDDLEGGSTGANLAYVVFTSGSTGRPKGVLVEHRQLVNYTRAVQERVDFPVDASFATVSTFAADLGNTMIFPALASGGCLHVLPPDRAADAAAMAADFASHGIDCLKIVPSHLEALLEAAADPGRVLPRRRLVLGGEALRPGTLERVRQAAPECAVFNHYGPSETTVGVLAHYAGELPADSRRRLVPLGRPLANCRVYLLDAYGAPVPAWVAGELCIAGDGVSRGYLLRPDLTAERFVPDPFSPSPGGRIYRTGDLARYLPDGVMEFLGRLDHQVKYHGFRVELEEIRSALNRHPQVRDSVVTLKNDKGGHDVLLAYYVARQEIDPLALREHLSEVILEETLPNIFVHLKKLPLTSNGKINHAALPTVEEAQKKAQRPYVAPRTPTEEILAGIWAAVLGLERVSAGDSFFELGGHSLLATQVASRARQSFQIELPLRALFDAATLADLAARVDGLLESGLAREAPPIEKVRRNGGLPLSFAQERLWFMDQLSPGNPAYNMQVGLRLSGRLDRAAFERSLRQIMDRHEALRTRFLDEGWKPVQVVREVVPLFLPLVDLRVLYASQREAEVGRRVYEEVRRPFDLTVGVLLRPLLFRLEDEEHVVLFVLHHIAADGWSLGLLVRELADFYAAWSSGRPPVARDLPVQYADYAVWQRRWLQGEELDRQLSYWERKLRGAPEVLELPADRPRPAAPSFRGAHLRFELPVDLSRALRALSRREGTTLFMTLLAVFNLLLARYTEREDIVVGTDVANRNRLETEGLFGFLVNNLVLRTDLTGDPGFRELLHRVRETTLGAYAHQDLPFDLLVKALRPRRHLSHTPLFQVLFVVQNAPGQLDLPGLRLAPLIQPRTTAKFDLAMFVREQGEQVTGSWNYSTDLFDEDTIQRMAGHFDKLLQGVCARPEARLSDFEMFTATERRRLVMQRDQRMISKANKLRSTRRETVDVASLEVVKTGFLGEPRLPVVISPQATEPVDLVEWARHNRPLLDEQRLRYGGLLFRGFDLGSVPGFERFAGAVCDELYADYGDLPSEEGGEKVYRSTPYPADKMILFHNESSHLDRWPSKQLFFCVTAAQSGGETPIVDCREVYRRLDPEVAERFERRKLMYVRNFTDGLDVSWRQFFRTEDPAVVERKCREAEMEIEWKEDGLRTRKVCDAVIVHPQTGEKVFFNQVQLHHLSCMDPGMRESMLAVFDGKDLPRDVRYGDGEPIEDEVMGHVSAVYRELAVSFPWQPGDVLMLDNMLVAHARNPFAGTRKIVVAMGEMTSRADLR